MITLMEILILLIIYFLLFYKENDPKIKIKLLAYFVSYIIIRFCIIFILDEILDLDFRRMNYYTISFLANSLVFNKIILKKIEFSKVINSHKNYDFLSSVYLICENLLLRVNQEIRELSIEDSKKVPKYFFCKNILMKFRDIEKELEFIAEFYITLSSELHFKKGIELNKAPEILLEKDTKIYITSFKEYPEIYLLISLCLIDNNNSSFTIVITEDVENWKSNF